MYYDKFLPFYMTYADSSLYSRERIQEQEFALMKSYYPDTARKIQEKAEMQCQLDTFEQVAEVIAKMTGIRLNNISEADDKLSAFNNDDTFLIINEISVV